MAGPTTGNSQTQRPSGADKSSAQAASGMTLEERARLEFDKPTEGGRLSLDSMKKNSNIFIARIRTNQIALPRASFNSGYVLFDDKALADLALPFPPTVEKVSDETIIKLYNVVLERGVSIPGVGNLVQNLAFQAVRAVDGGRFFKGPKEGDLEAVTVTRPWKEATYNWVSLNEWAKTLLPRSSTQDAAPSQGSAEDQRLAAELNQDQAKTGAVPTGYKEQVATIGAICLVLCRLICKEAKSVYEYLKGERFENLYTKLYSDSPAKEIARPSLTLVAKLKPQFSSPGAQALMMETVRAFEVAQEENDLARAGVAHGLLGQIVQESGIPLWHFLDQLAEITKLSHLELLAELYGSGTRTQVDWFAQAYYSYQGTADDVAEFNTMNLEGQAVKVNNKYWRVARLLNPKWNKQFARSGNELLIDLIIGAYNNINPSRKIKTTEGGFVCYQSAAPTVLKEGVAKFVTQIGARLEQDVDGTPVTRALAEAIKTKISSSIVLEFVGGRTETAATTSTLPNSEEVFGDDPLPTAAPEPSVNADDIQDEDMM